MLAFKVTVDGNSGRQNKLIVKSILSYQNEQGKLGNMDFG